MKRFWKRFVRFCVTGLLAAWILTLPGALLAQGPSPRAQATTDGIDEIVVVGTDGYVYAYDYQGRQVFKSPENGWQLVTTGDLNGDGDHEIIAVGGNRIKAYDPQIVNTEYDFDVTYTGSSGSFKKVGVGYLVGGDDRLDIALIRSVGGTESRIVIYKTTSTSPAKDVQFLFTNWDNFAIADYDGDGDEDFALTYWNNSYPSGVKSWLELWKGHDPSQRLEGSSTNGLYSDLVWFDIAAGNFVTDNGNKVELVGSQNVNNIRVLKWSSKKLKDVWSVGPAFEFVAAADFRGDGDAQVAMLRNVSSGVSLQFARSGNSNMKPWASISGLGTGWLNLAAGNLDTEKLKKEAVIIKSNLIRVYLQPQNGQNGEDTYLDCNTIGNCFEAFNLSGQLNGELAVGDLGINFKTVTPYEVTPATLVHTVVQSSTVPSDTFYIYGEKAVGVPLRWGAVVLSDVSARRLQRLAARHSDLSLSVTPDGLSYRGDGGTGQLPIVNWVTLSAYTGTTPSTLTVAYSDTHAGSPIFEAGAHKATILVWQDDLPTDRFRYADVLVLVAAKMVYLPVILK